MPNRKLDERSQSRRLQMVTTRAWLRRVMIYAKKTNVTQSEAIRALVNQALQSHKI
jgi:hypothetical protein